MKPYYKQDGITIYHGDCREILPTLEKVDLVLTSPPYDNLREYGGQGFQFSDIPCLLYRVMADGACCVWVVSDQTVCGSETGSSFKQALTFMESGFNLHDTMIYAKNNYIPLTHNRYEQSFEFMFVFSKGRPNAFNPLLKQNKQVGAIKGGSFRQKKDELGSRHKDVGVRELSYRSNIWFYNVGMMNSTKNRIAFKHPAIFPEALASDHITSWSNQGNIILDPFLGSGTTAVVAKKLNRWCIGIEIEEKYCEIAAKRCQQQAMSLDIPIKTIADKQQSMGLEI